MTWQPLVVQLGQSAQAFALALSVVGMGVSVWALKSDTKAPRRLALWMLVLAAVTLTVAMGCLEVAFHTRDFNVKYVYEHSNTTLPLFYTTAALWGGHEGSLLLWAWLLSVYAALSIGLNRHRHERELPYVMLIQMGLLAFFMGLIFFFSNPFDLVFPGGPGVAFDHLRLLDGAKAWDVPGNLVIAEGQNLNPLLQDPGMVIHPPMLYLGYVGFTVPFAFAMGGLLAGRVDGQWLFTVRRWALSAWLFLTVGITLGAFWAYRELGWGGWWGWDPVENASFLPWLLGTAFLHSMMVQEKRRTFKLWTLGLCILTYAMSLFGTFLVRSGVLTSVHSFASSPERGVYLLAFFTLVTGGSFLLLAVKSAKLRHSDVELENVVSREGAFLFNNMFLVVAAAAVFGGTVYPLVLEAIDESMKISVGPPYFNKVFAPLMTALLVLMGIGPLIPWRRITWHYARRNFAFPLAAGVAGAVVAAVAVRPSLGVIVGGFAMAMSLGGIAREFWLTTKRKGAVSLGAGAKRVGRNRRKYGGLIIHAGILAYAAAIMTTVTLRTEADYHLREGDHFYTGAYHVFFKGVDQVQGPNYTATQATLDVYHGGNPVARLIPQKRSYGEGMMDTTEASIYTTLKEDFYTVLGEVDEDGKGAVVRVYHNPLVVWLWVGAVVVIVGSLLSLTHRQRPVDQLEVLP